MRKTLIAMLAAALAAPAWSAGRKPQRDPFEYVERRSQVQVALWEFLKEAEGAYPDLRQLDRLLPDARAHVYKEGDPRVLRASERADLQALDARLRAAADRLVQPCGREDRLLDADCWKRARENLRKASDAVRDMSLLMDTPLDWLEPWERDFEERGELVFAYSDAALKGDVLNRLMDLDLLLGSGSLFANAMVGAAETMRERERSEASAGGGPL